MTKTVKFEKNRIALIAHDNKKPDLIEWATYNKTTLTKHAPKQPDFDTHNERFDTEPVDTVDTNQ